MMKYLADVVTLNLIEEKCNGCGMCVIVCPHGVLEIVGRKVRTTDRDLCMECGACARNCPTEAIQVRAGVGCATGAIMAAFGKKGDCCCA
ncbi:MAG: 4Fe-4S binding protein [Candidatus Eisenbacteria bacterium]|uniref:4Fe-4S binding protein n=1 Tax=Eiseniibacteriota bacterium TaxID=2212470 RepID=A0A948S0T9_UNCEI|nr:4Fe-4S binding protein [Candidatus Eisenbacteria bacterium]MBU1950744.1 4Fe-4S binding protein [Candidatus Eisenbacteria bacterium]MBU2693119.1 4Fe-4S binding protein [Candidatus Eisenbacteria bacterium]